MGLTPQQRVCLVVQRSLPMIVSILAILKCGCQYVPLDGQVTADSALQHIIKDTQSHFVLCLEKFHKKVSDMVDPATQIVVLDKALEQVVSPSRPSIDVRGVNGAYCIYTSGMSFSEMIADFSNKTSGSTGPPKGVDVTHRNVTNLLCHSPGNLNIGSGTLVAQLLSISFDMGKHPFHTPPLVASSI